MKKNAFVHASLALAIAAALAACGGGGGAPYENGGNNGGGNNGGGNGNPSSGISIRVGSGDTITTIAQEIKYRQRFAVTVSDSAGKPVQGATISVRAMPYAYANGSWAGGTQTRSATCNTEDTNGNDIADAGEDINNNGRLDPPSASVVAKLEGGVNVTDADGIAYIVADWNKSDASWIFFTLAVSATGASGATELVESSPNTTGFVVGDESKDSSAFTYSPFGQSGSCSDAS